MTKQHEYIKIDNFEVEYPINYIILESSNVIEIQFVNEIPNKLGDVSLYTKGGELCNIFKGYKTIYRTTVEEKIYWLSNNDSIYKEAEKIAEMEYKEYIPTLEELKNIKINEMASICTKTIEVGVDIPNIGNVSLKDKDQSLLLGMSLRLLNPTETKFEYHADGQACKFYTRQEMELIVKVTMEYIAFHQAYINCLNLWIRAVENKDELEKIEYNPIRFNIPPQHVTEVMAAYLERV